MSILLYKVSKKLDRKEQMRVKVKDAAAALGVSEQYIRIGMQTGRLPIGSCVKMSSVWTYHISEEKLREYLGEIKMPPAAN